VASGREVVVMASVPGADEVGTTAFDGEEAGPVPLALVAVTVNV
jgi:hypothetical protein